MLTPETLKPAAAHLYAQFAHLEVGDPENGLTAADVGYPVATVCAALAAPVERLYELLALPLRPWEPAFDLDACPGWLLPWVANFGGVELPPGLSEDEVRARLRDADARRRGTIRAMVQRAEETLGAGGVVYFRERDGSAYRIVMAAYASADPVLTLQRVREVKPGGVVLELDVAPGPTYGLTRAALDSYSEVLTAHPSYVDLRDTVPA